MWILGLKGLSNDDDNSKNAIGLDRDWQNNNSCTCIALSWTFLSRRWTTTA